MFTYELAAMIKRSIPHSCQPLVGIGKEKERKEKITPVHCYWHQLYAHENKLVIGIGDISR